MSDTNITSYEAIAQILLNMPVNTNVSFSLLAKPSKDEMSMAKSKIQQAMGDKCKKVICTYRKGQIHFKWLYI